MNIDSKYVFILKNEFSGEKIVYLGIDAEPDEHGFFEDETLKLSEALTLDSLEEAKQFYTICNLKDYTLSEVKGSKIFKAWLEDK